MCALTHTNAQTHTHTNAHTHTHTHTHTHDTLAGEAMMAAINVSGLSQVTLTVTL